MCVWNDEMLRFACEHDRLVDPYNPSCINPASIDLCLGGQYRRTHPLWDDYGRSALRDHEQFVDVPLWGEPIDLNIGESFWLLPNEFVLCHSLETVNIPVTACAFLYSKSSTGRRGLEHLHCLAGDTLIDMPRDLSVYPQGIPIAELAVGGKEFLTYVFDRERMAFTLAPARAFPAKQQTKVVRVDYEWMTGGYWHFSSLTCTPDHRLLTLGGNWVEAQDAHGLRLRPFGRGIENYAYILPYPLKQKTVHEHRFVAEFLYGDVLTGRETHHVDGNKINNNPSNLSVINSGEHQSLHSSGSNNPFYGKKHTPATRAQLSSVRRNREFSAETRRKLSVAATGINNPRFLALSLDAIVAAYQEAGSLERAAQQLNVDEGTLARKVKEYGYKNTVDFRHSLQVQGNHKVTGVTWLEQPQDTYDIHVPGYENFVANGVVVHNSGFGDPGFIGQWTWELQNVSPAPIKLVVGKPLMQMIMLQMTNPPQLDYGFTGHYMNQTGATPARV